MNRIILLRGGIAIVQVGGGLLVGAGVCWCVRPNRVTSDLCIVGGVMIFAGIGMIVGALFS